jgi:long-subunit fatty acid transport protein
MWLLFSALAQAGGFYFSDSGIVASGRAGAWIAGANTQFAQYYNPAGLIHVEAPTASAGLSGVRQIVHFDRIDSAGTAMARASNLGPAFSVPELGFAMPIKDKFAIAFGFTSPFAPSYQYTRDGSQRYSLIDSTIWLFAVGPSAAWRPVPWLTVGAGVGVQALRVDQELMITTSGPFQDGSDNPQGDVRVEARTWDRAKPFFNVGVLIDPDPHVTIGLSVTPPAKFRAKGPGLLDFTGHALEQRLDQVVWRDDSDTLNVDLPVIARVGVAVRPVERWEIELAAVWEQWSSLADIQVEDIDVVVTSQQFNLERRVPPNLRLPAGFRDNLSLRLGGEWQADRDLAVRAGMMWERGSLPAERISVSLVDPWKLQGSTGLSAWFLRGRLRVDGMASYLYLPTLRITDSVVDHIAVPVLTDSVASGIVGNGTLRSHGWTAGLGASWIFRKPHPRRHELPAAPNENTPEEL